ncbi:kinase [Caulobacter sp. NIBR1757]|uniref:kinase n=1 Tax=Caulobacter sp. NIBR1757 TaxID=3016000 RepID=UPI0022F03E38|nr:kinase [Caulobacter sp. NIBR1757]
MSGCQGSGKTTLVKAVAQAIGAAHLSLDDLYCTAHQRAHLAEALHPLFATRGPPGTHDLPTLSRLLDQLASAGAGDSTPLPAFDKLADDRLPPEAWPVFKGRPTAILVEGWCLGATPQAPEKLAESVNALERDEDPDGVWRGAINRFLAGPYATMFSRFDNFLHMRAPAFEAVQGWREEQQAGLLGRQLFPEEKVGLFRFIQHYERLTRHMLAGGLLPGLVVQLDANRRPQGIPLASPQ